MTVSKRQACFLFFFYLSLLLSNRKTLCIVWSAVKHYLKESENSLYVKNTAHNASRRKARRGRPQRWGGAQAQFGITSKRSKKKGLSKRPKFVADIASKPCRVQRRTCQHNTPTAAVIHTPSAALLSTDVLLYRESRNLPILWNLSNRIIPIYCIFSAIYWRKRHNWK